MIFKSASLILALFLLVSPLGQAFAQETVDNTDERTNVSRESDNTSTDSVAIQQEEQAMAMSGGSVTVEGGSVYISDSGILSGAPDVDAQTGAYTHKYPLIVPLGRDGLTPKLSLDYDSNDRSPDNIFGYGWSVPVKQIHRINKTGLENLYTENNFVSDLDGELVTSNGTEFAAEFDKGDFRKYTYSNNRWIVLDKNGTRYSFGSTSSSTMHDAASSTRVYAWYLDEIRDANDNFIKFTYYKNSNRLYPSTIVYSGHGTTDGINTINFLRENRPDTYVSYATGFPATTTDRINEIRIDVGGVWTRKYELDYGTGENGNRSLLTSVTESGNGPQGTVSLPPFRFDYSDISANDQGWSDDNSFTVPERIINTHEGLDQGVRFFDVNGDGYADLTMYKNTSLLAANNVIEKIYLNTGSAWEEDNTWSFPQPAAKMAFTGQDYDGYHDLGARFADVDSDGYTDILWSINKCFNGYTCVNFRKVYINNRVDGWIESTTTWQLPSDVYFNASGVANGGGNELADVNGDGLVDIIKSARYTINGGGTYTYSTKTYLNNGSGWVEAGDVWDSPEIFEEQSEDAGTRLVELNGDGLIDIVRHVDSDYDESILEVDKAYLNTGEGWVESNNWKSPLPFLSILLNYRDPTHSTRLVDINGDGLTDIFANETGAYTSAQEIYINTGEGWSNQTANWEFGTSTLLSYGYVHNGYWLTDAGVRLVDFDGDNMVDFAKNGPTNTFPNDPVYVNEIITHKGDVPDLLKTVVNSSGGTTTVEYKQSAQYQKNDELVNGNISINLDTVAKITRDNGFGNTYDTEYFYENGHYFFASSTNRQFAGFAKMTEITDLGTTTIYYHQGDGNNASSSELNDAEAKIGLSYQTEITDAGGNLYLLDRTNWSTSSPSLGLFVFKESELVQQYDGNADHKDSAVSYLYNSQNGNLNSKTEWGEVSASTTGTFSDLGTDKRTTSYTYATNTTTYIIGLPSSEQVTDNSGTKVSETRYYYDNQSLGNVDDGNVTKKERWVSGSNYVDEEWTYNSYGLPLTSKDARDKTTSYVYDSFNLYPASSTNPLSQTTEYEYDYSSGKVATTTDPNGEIYVTVYDGLDRPLFEKIPDPQTGSTVTQNEYVYTDTQGAVKVQKKAYLTPSVTNSVYTYLDGFGRTIQERLEVEDSNTYAVKDFVYGPNGLLQKESLPYTNSDTSRTTATTDGDLYTEYGYDALSRVTSALTTVGTTSTAYDQWTEIVTDANGNDKKFTYDAFKRLGQVDEYNGTSTYTTIYTWNPRNDLIKITDALGNEHNINYDGLSRRTSLQDLHDTGDTTFGTWTFVYDAAGNVASSTDPKGQIVAYTYDDLNRILAENYQGAAGTEVVYDYDSCTEGVGRPCEVANGIATTTFTYTYNGLPASETKTILGTAYTTGYEYDRLGNKTLIIYPDDSEVKYTYNKANKIETIEQKESGGSFDYVINDFDYGPHGLVTYQLNGNGASTTRKYDENELYRLRNIITTSTTTEGMGGGGQELALAEDDLLLMGILTDEIETRELQTEVTITEGADEGRQSTSTIEEEVSAVEEQSVITELPADPTTTSMEVSDQATSTVPEPETSNPPDSSETSQEPHKVSEPTPEPTTGKYTDKGDKFELKLGKSDSVAIIKDKPEINLRKWNGEVDLGVSYEKMNESAKVVENTDRVEWKGEKEEVHAYPLEKSKKLENGGFEIEVVLNEIPDTNTFTFNLDGYEDLDFFYQPPLIEEAEEGEVCSETSCTNAAGEITKERPEHIVGSYAVYHKEKRNHFEGEENYQVGKVFHILRPQITDASGNKVWGELSYAGNTLTVTVPQDFLNTATYPVVVDPTFGYTPVGGTSKLVGTDNYEGSLFTSPSDYGTFTSLSIYCDKGTSGSENIKAAIVVHSSLNLATSGVSDAVSCVYGSPEWKTPSFSSSPSLSASTEYLLGAVASGARARLFYDTGVSNQGHYDGSNNYTTPTNLGSATHSTRKYSAYITYSTGGGGNATPTTPFLLEIEGQINPTDITDSTPEFTAIYNDPDSGDLANFYRIQVATSTSFTSNIWDSTKTALATTTEGTRSGAVSYAGSILASSTTYYWRIKFWDDGGLEGAWSTTTASFSLVAGTPANATPTAPTLLEAEGQTNPTNTIDPTPEFTAIFNDPDAGDIATHYQLQVATSSGFSNIYWDSGSTTLASTTSEGNRTPEISYGGSALTSSTTYYWRIKFWDDGGLEGDWSTTTATFSLASGTSSEPTFTPFVELVQHLSYTYDAVGNITQIVDASDTLSAATTSYAYDDLYRLTSASTTMASSTPYVQTYSYDALGNITNKSDQGAYSYAGDTGTNYANPHAVTSIAGVTYKYDKNGNLASTTAGTLYSWDYLNRLLESTVGSTTSSYGYDHSGARVLKTNAEGVITGGSTPGDTGFKSPTVTGATYNEWNYSAPSNAYSSNDAYASGVSDSSGDEQDYYNFSFDIPSEATIDGIEVQVEFKAAYNKTDSLEAALSWNGGSSITSLKSNSWSDEEKTYKSYGSSTDTWGRSWDDSEFSNANFRVYFHQPSNWYGNGVDHVQAKVYYTVSTESESTSTSTTMYPSDVYEEIGATTTKHIFAGDMLVATIEEATPVPKVYYNHVDHLNSSNASTDDIGYLNQVLNYYPFGSSRIDTQYGPLNQMNRFTGHTYDEETELLYLGARYYPGNTGRFISQDPVALALGNWKEVAKMTKINREDYLKQPQKHNAYSYAGNNPLRYVDPYGESYWELNAGVAVSPYAGNFGLKIDFENSRMDFTYGAGPAAGASADLSLLYNSNDLPEARSYITEEVEGVAGYGLIGKGSYGAQIGSPKPGDIEFNGGMSYGIGAGGGLSGAVTANHSFTLVDFSRNYNILKAALTKFAENLKAYSDFQKEMDHKKKDEDKN